MFHSEARTIFDDITKNQPSNTWISWVNAQMLCFRLSREYVTVDPGTAISVSDRFRRILDVQSAPHAFLLALNFNTLHDLLRVVSL